MGSKIPGVRWRRPIRGKSSPSNPIRTSAPVWKITGIGKLTVIGPDATGGTIGWSLDTGGHELRAVGATGASLFGIQIGQNSFGNSVSFNSVTASPVGVQIDGDSNIVKGGPFRATRVTAS